MASYDEDGKLTKVVKEYVTESSSTVLNVKNGDKVMYWDGLETMNPLSDAVTAVSYTHLSDTGRCRWLSWLVLQRPKGNL